MHVCKSRTWRHKYSEKIKKTCMSPFVLYSLSVLVSSLTVLTANKHVFKFMNQVFFQEKLYESLFSCPSCCSEAVCPLGGSLDLIFFKYFLILSADVISVW